MSDPSLAVLMDVGEVVLARGRPLLDDFKHIRAVKVGVTGEFNGFNEEAWALGLGRYAPHAVLIVFPGGIRVPNAGHTNDLPDFFFVSSGIPLNSFKICKLFRVNMLPC